MVVDFKLLNQATAANITESPVSLLRFGELNFRTIRQGVYESNCVHGAFKTLLVQIKCKGADIFSDTYTMRYDINMHELQRWTQCVKETCLKN